MTASRTISSKLPRYSRRRIKSMLANKLGPCKRTACGRWLVLKCLDEILLSVGSPAMPAGATGCYTMLDQALDLGLLAPFGIVTGVLLLRRESLGYLLSSSSLISLLVSGAVSDRRRSHAGAV